MKIGRVGASSSTIGVCGREQSQRVGWSFFVIVADLFPVFPDVVLHRAGHHFFATRLRAIHLLNIDMLDRILYIAVPVGIPGTRLRCFCVGRNGYHGLSFFFGKDSLGARSFVDLAFFNLSPFTSGQGIIPDLQPVQRIRKSTMARISIFFLV